MEALELLEPYFAKANALAGVTRTASRFHRQQEIVEYVAHANVKDAYANTCEFRSAHFKRLPSESDASGSDV
jgi:hypothetical protein